MFKKHIPVWWLPQEGVQTAAVTCPVDEIGMFGNRGGGKTQAAIGRQVRGASKWGPMWNGLMIRKKYKQLAGLRRDFDELIMNNDMPAERVGGDRETNYIRFKNGANITLASIQDLKASGDYQGHGYTEISIEEAAEYPFIAELVDRLYGAMRSGGGVPSKLFLTGNPGGPGASQLKAMFLLDDTGNQRKPNKAFKVDGISRIFIPSDTEDNKILMSNDPGYKDRLKAIKDPVLRAAWLEGSFDAIIGQAFTLESSNIIEPIWPIPKYATLIMTFDWGWGAPFSVQWFWVDGEGRLYLAAEWYGLASINQPNKGLRLTDPQIARGILEREKHMGILGEPITRLAGHDCANRKPNYETGIQGPSTVEEFIKVASDVNVRHEFGKDIHLNLFTMKPDKMAKIKQFRERIRIPRDEQDRVTGPPMMVIYDTCTHFRRIIPTLSMSDTDYEQLEKGQEDHVFDSACLACMSRPVGVTDHELEKLRADEEMRLRPKVDSLSQAAAADYRYELERLIGEMDETYHAGIPIQ